MFFIGGLIVNTLLGPLIDMAAYSFAAQSLIAPFGGWRSGRPPRSQAPLGGFVRNNRRNEPGSNASRGGMAAKQNSAGETDHESRVQVGWATVLGVRLACASEREHFDQDVHASCRGLRGMHLWRGSAQSVREDWLPGVLCAKSNAGRPLSMGVGMSLHTDE